MRGLGFGGRGGMVLARSAEPRPWRPLIPPEQAARHAGRATLVLDMNHTLVAAAASRREAYDLESRVPGTGAVMLTRKRPFVDAFLRRAAEAFEVVAFTSCPRRLADPILDQLDPAGSVFAHRLYADSCSWCPRAGHVKDLSMLGRGMERVLIVDDSESKCVWNPDNWLPVSRFEADARDRELLELVPLLEELARLDDVRPALRKRVQEWKRKVN